MPARVLPFEHTATTAEPWLPAYLTAGKSFEDWRTDWLRWALLHFPRKAKPTPRPARRRA